MGFSVSDIIMQQGDAAAKARQARGTLWGSLAQYAGTIPREIIAGEQQKREQAQVEQVRQLQIQKGQAEAQQQQDEQGKLEVLRQVYRVARKPDGTIDEQQAEAIIAQSRFPELTELRAKARQAGLDKELEASVKRSTVTKNEAEAAAAAALAKQRGEPPTPQPYTLGEGQVRMGGDNQPVATGPTKPAPPLTYGAPIAVMSKGVRTLVRPGSDGKLYSVRTGEAVSDVDPDVRPPTGGGGGAAGTDATNVADAVAAMAAGTVPPLLPGRASREYVAMLAEAKRQGVDLAGLATDWMATQKHIASLNGAQQLRLNQAIGQLPELLDSVDALAERWKGGGFPILNRANLAAAKNGIYGQEAASIAQQLETQIADVNSDIGTVYMGGNSPTDKALDLARTALKGEWSEKVIHDMTALARKNVTIRQHSIANTGVAGASPDNPYAPTQAAPPAAPTAPAGWKYVPKAGGGWTAVEDK